MTGVWNGATFEQPRWRALINGQPVAGCGLVSGNIDATNYSKGDTFDARISLDYAQVPKPFWFDPANPETPIDVIIQMGMLPPGQPEGSLPWYNQFEGIVDKVTYDPEKQELHVEGRDNMARLLDTQIQAAWLNHTGTDLLNLLITAAGLTPDVQLPSNSGYNGQFWQLEHKRGAHTAGSRFRTAFDLARFIVDGEECDMWAEGKTIKVRPFGTSGLPLSLHFQQPGPGTAVSSVLSLMLERDPVIAKGVVVQVIGWDSKQRAKHVYVWSGSGNGPGVAKLADAKGTLHTFTRPNLRMDAAQKLAKQKYDQIVAQQRTISFSMPGDLTLSPRQSIVVSGTGTSWDTTLQVDAVSRSFGEDGFTQQVTLRNRQVSEDDPSNDT